MDLKPSNSTLSKTICELLKHHNIKNICISPGSRNTPLTNMLINDEFFNCYSILDERSSAYFALGISKSNGDSAVILTTSGTAVGNLLPAIIESDQSMSPLIIISADRPNKMIGTGENQTINQQNIFKNNIRDFINVESEIDSSNSFVNKINLMILKSKGLKEEPPGPIHINIAFNEPLIDELNFKSFKIKTLKKESKSISKSIKNYKRPLIVCGQIDTYKNINKKILNLSEKLNAPIIAEITSQLRFNNTHPNILSHYEFFIEDIIEPDCIIQFGKKPTISKKLTKLINNCEHRILLSDSKGYNDDCKNVFPLSCIIKIENTTDSQWSSNLKSLNTSIESKLASLNDELFYDGSIISNILKTLKNNDNVFIGNSLCIRNMNKYSINSNNSINIFCNRGASGIDGITSTALGMAIMNKEHNNLLITGDLSFIHDLNALLIAQLNKINLTIIVMNNNGGQIFSKLPYAKTDDNFKKYWLTPQKIQIKNIAQLYNLNYCEIDSLADLKEKFNHIIEDTTQNSNVNIIEIKCDTNNSSKTEKRINDLIFN